MHEVVLQRVFSETKVSVISGLDIPLFKKFQENWPNVDIYKFSTFLTDHEVHEKFKIQEMKKYE